MSVKDLEARSEHWREDWRVTVPANDTSTVRERNYRFELKDEDEPRVDPKHPAHHTLSWIACVDDHCDMHRVPKAKNRKYPVRMHWMKTEKKFRDAKFVHGWHPVDTQEEGDLRLQPGRYLTEECLEGRQWWECPENTCPWHVEEKKRTKYWPKKEAQSGKEEAYWTRGSQ